MKTSLTPAAAMIVLAMTAGVGMAQTTATTTTTTTSTTTSTAAPTTTVPAPETKLIATYGGWAGSPENASALVSGLRTGKAITLAPAPRGASTGTSSTTTATTFTPPTKPMGYGNIRIALNLAQQQLASQGISQPTPQQMQTALMGGTLTTGTGATAQTTNMQGVLQMRASGMGWGKIANTLGYKLGPVMSGKAPATATSGVTAADGSTGGAAVAKTTHGKAGSGITTAAGSSTGGTAAGKTSHGKAGSGIVTAAGTTGGGITTGMGQSQSHAGVVTAQGGGAASSHAGSQGKGGK